MNDPTDFNHSLRIAAYGSPPSRYLHDAQFRMLVKVMSDEMFAGRLTAQDFTDALKVAEELTEHRRKLDNR